METCGAKKRSRRVHSDSPTYPHIPLSPASLKTEASNHAILTSLSARRLKGQNSCTAKSDY